jgi:hypothetical protein
MRCKLQFANGVIGDILAERSDGRRQIGNNLLMQTGADRIGGGTAAISGQDAANGQTIRGEVMR